MTKFEEFQLKSELLNSLHKIGFDEATEVQEKAIPLALEGTDMVVRSKTGTGKTGAFLIPIIQKLEKKDRNAALIVAPTRELALQVYEVASQMGMSSGIRSTVVYGKVSIERQIQNIHRGTNIIIGTPGRLIDLMKRGELDLSRVRFVVLDEADIMFDLGFIEDVEYILSKTPATRQTMLLSATVQERILKLAKKHMHEPEFIKVGEEKVLTVNTISHSYAFSADHSKIATLLAYLNEYKPPKSIIFSETKRGADYIYKILVKQGYSAMVMHGDLTQAQREHSLEQFRKSAQFLVATNVAARGLDIDDVSDVINFDLPGEPEVYVHRVGRSARMGKNGTAFSIIYDDEMNLIKNIEKNVKIHMSRIELDQEPFAHISDSISMGMRGGQRPRRNMGSRPGYSNNRRRPGNRTYGGSRSY
ncbi:MAG: DEAD/DEAH box helicase [Candidatus Thermoplasmatota archaeon]|jgi:ATP-dependent RNA helicase DeaD|nr:DEAD/DEAH box helicase [Candidatus Thermoplasmatota archaeon]